jgi:hypothetical protein
MKVKTRLMIENHQQPASWTVNEYTRPEPPKREDVLTILPAPVEYTKQVKASLITPQEFKPEPSEPLGPLDRLDLFGQAIDPSEGYASVAIFDDCALRRNHSFDFEDSEDDFALSTKHEVCLAFWYV